VPATDYTPSVVQVARKDLSRTRDKYGNLVGTFNADTQPTDTQVMSLTGDLLTEVADVIGDDIPTPYFDDAANVVALRTAMQIELDYFSEQVNTGRSIYPQLKEQYDTALKNLIKAINSDDPTTPGVEGGGASMRPSYGFPEAKTGWSTRW
jgi:hypothetical protein